MIEAKVVDQSQVAEAILSCRQTSNARDQDETSKCCRHFQSLQITVAKGYIRSVGLSKVARGEKLQKLKHELLSFVWGQRNS